MNGSKKEDDTAGQPRAVGWETVQIFISSTFNDMHAERDYLVKEVFPELRDWCEERKLRLVDIDLRWGVTETDATRNKNVVQVCLDRIDKARPFFVCFLGQRYGWIPEDDEIAPETFMNFVGLGRAVEQSASVTEMEVLHALLRDPFDQGAGTRLPSEHAFFYLRDPGYLEQMPSDLPRLRRTYTDDAEPDAERREFLMRKQAELRKTVIGKTNRPARPYSGQWNPAARTPELALPLLCPSSDKKNRERWRKQWKDWAGVATTDEAVVAADEAKARAFNDRLCAGRLEGFQSQDRTLGAVILDDLKGAILARYPERKDLPEQDELEQEIDRHEDFVHTATDVFIERTGDFADLDAYATGDSRKLFVLVASAGLGKSTLLANWVARWRSRDGKPADETVHARFVGVDERSSTVDALLQSILEELQRTSKWPTQEGDERPDLPEQEAPIPDSPNLLRSKFAQLLGECGKKGRAVVVIDALDQLQSGLADLGWLARTLPEDLKLVVSFRLGDKQGDALAAEMRADGRVTVSEVRPFTNLRHRRELVDAYLDQYLKELDEQHMKALIRADGTENPLFLKVVLTELRVFGAFARLGEMIKHEFGTTPQTAFDAVLRRLENDPSYAAVPSSQAVPLLFGLLAHARGGLPEDLLVRMFLDELGFGENRSDNMRATIRLLLRQVRPFLARREGRTDFFYEAFRLAARARYTDEECVTSSIPATRGRLGSWRKLLDRVRGTGLSARRVVELSAGTSIGSAPLAPHRRPRPRWHSRLARTCEKWAKLESAAKRYALRNLVYHEVEAGNGAAAAEAMTEFGYHYERFRTFERNDVVTVMADFALIDDAPGLTPAARERVSVWKAFLAENAHVLLREDAHLSPETSFLQLAVAHANTSLVTTSAEQWLETVGSRVHWLRSLQPPREVERTACLRTFEGQSFVASIALSSDGRRAISGSMDDKLKLWDVETGICLRTLEHWSETSEQFGESTGVRTVALSSDGRRALSAGGGKTLKLWDLDSGECLQTLHGHTDAVVAAALSSDDRRALSGSADGSYRRSADKTLKLWDLRTGQCLLTLQGHTNGVLAVAFLPDDRRALSSSADRTLKLWDLRTGQCLRTLEGHTQFVMAVALSPDGRRALSGSADGTLKLWDLESGQCLQTLQGHTQVVWAVAASSDGRRALSGSVDRTLKLWDLECGRCVFTIKVPFVRAVAFLPDGRRALSGGEDGTLKLWDLDYAQQPQTPQEHHASVDDIALAPDGRRSLLRGKTLELWDLDTGQCLHTFQGHTSRVRAVALLPDGRRAISRSDDKTLKLWDLDTGLCLRTLEGHTESVKTVVLLPDGRRVLSGSDDKTLKLWDLDTGQCLQTLEGHTKTVDTVALSFDGRRVLSGSHDDTLKLWDLASGQCLQTLRHADAAAAIARSPDGRRRARLAAQVRNTGILKNLLGDTGPTPGEGDTDPTPGEGDTDPTPGEGDTGPTPGEGDTGPTPGVRAVALSPNGRHALSVVTCAFGDILAFWDVITGQYLGMVDGYDSAMLLPDGRRVISWSESRETLILWDLDTGLCLRTLEGHTESVKTVVLLPDGRRVLSGSDHNTLKLWDLDTGQCLHTLAGHKGWYPGAIALLPDGRRVLSTSGRISSGEVKLWDLDTALCMATWQARTPVHRCAAGFEVIVADTEDGVLFLKLMPPGCISPETTAAIWHPSRLLLAVARANGTILVQEWHPTSQYLEEVARCPGSPIERLRWSREGAHLLVVARDGTKRILDATTLREASAPACPWSDPRSISPDGLWRAEIRVGRIEVVTNAASPDR